MTKTEIVVEMCRRVGLPTRTGTEIYMIALRYAVSIGKATVDMVLVANAIKYASDNKHLLKPQWRH